MDPPKEIKFQRPTFNRKTFKIIISRNSDWKSVDVADAACCDELWPLIPSMFTMSQQRSCVDFVQSTAAHTSAKCKCTVCRRESFWLLGSLAHLVFSLAIVVLWVYHRITIGHSFHNTNLFLTCSSAADCNFPPFHLRPTAASRRVSRGVDPLGP